MHSQVWYTQILIREVHGGSLSGHCGENKTLRMLREHYYSPIMTKDILKRCATCEVAKSQLLPEGLHTPLPVPTIPWVNMSIDFILGLPKS